MDIRNVPVGLSHPDVLRQDAVHAPEKPNTVPGTSSPSDGAVAGGDRVDLTRLRRVAAAPPEEVQFARKALDSLPPTDSARMEEIRARMQGGYYQQPEVLSQLAGRLGEALISGA